MSGDVTLLDRPWLLERAGQPMPDGETVDDALSVATVGSDFNALFVAPYLGTPGVMMPRARLLELLGRIS